MEPTGRAKRGPLAGSAECGDGLAAGAAAPPGDELHRDGLMIVF